MKKILMAALMMGTAMSTQAQSEWFQNVKFSGYGMVQYQASDQDGAENNGFNLRLVRMALEGRAHQDFYWKVQMQINGNTYDPDKAKTDIRLVDLFGEWQKYEFFKVKAGQFKRPFTFENPMHPITQGFMSYSQNVSKLAGFSDRTGEQGSNGRDLGVQLQGDFLKDASGRNLLHYQVGVFNGEGINQKDKDNRKDIIGGMWVMPVKGMRIGAFGWTGSRGNMLDPVTGTTRSVEKNRYCLSIEYDKDEYTFRAEYLHSQGWGAKSPGNNVREIDYSKGDKADGWYVFGIVPLIKGKLHAKARYETYRNQKEWDTSLNQFEVGLNYFFTKNLELHAEYARINDRTLADGKHNYNMVDLELDFRF
jgi:hypothetical protein